MRLLHTKESGPNNFIIESFPDNQIPTYAILSHTWEQEEITFQDIETGAINKKGLKKLKNSCALARANGYDYIWNDTCCIDKTSSAELSEVLNSMYYYYQEADVCYAFLSDVPSKPLAESRWFTRGWTLQELIAPFNVIFLDEEWKEIGTKESMRVALSEITGIPAGILLGVDDVETASVAQRMSWAARRVTTRLEDRAYCLMGIFGIHMPPIYGEGKRAFIRLQEEIMRVLDDHSIFAWKSESEEDTHGGLLASSPDAFRDCANIAPYNPFTTLDGPLTVSSKGIHLELRFVGIGRPGLGLGILHCTESKKGEDDKLVAIYLQDSFLTMQHFKRIQSGRFELIDPKELGPSQYPLKRLCVRQGRSANRKAMIRRSAEAKMFALAEVHGQSLMEPLRACSETLHSWIRVNKIEGSGQILLSHAARMGHVDMLWLLLTRSDVQANGKDSNGRTPLSHAAEAGKEAVIKYLLTRVDVEPDAQDDDKRTPLSLAAVSGHSNSVELLLQSGRTYIDSKCKANRTPLTWAAINGHKEVVRVLLENGANPESRASFERTVLSWAADNGHEEVVSLLLDKGANIEAVDDSSKTALSIAAERGQAAVVELLLERGAAIERLAEQGLSPLSLAAKRGHVAAMKTLIERGAFIDCLDWDNRTPLCRVAELGHDAAVRMLLEHGADIEAKVYPHRTPLSLAAGRGHEAVVRILLEHGACKESKDNRGRKPLLHAESNGHNLVVELLQSNGK